MVTLAERLRSLRKCRDKTLRDIAASSGISLSYLSDIERGALPGIEVLEALADAYGLTVSDVMQGVRISGPMPLSYDI
jgi:transcriptional regulator with XRE-family HTH domain